ncbi:L,D-transpeptidase family protein [Sphingobium chlorophenolicum]|uniref:ErfK/YbiS/YcfS/YnhG family protein n=1 Tax=Sphingobium chlorophenolicum TaxID=46429 RepID=A0A081RIB7_SPHCR|nr:L,D-transpeptidase family protein [Sphingobium chlorophenolicum]KEQ54940.1 ErfK/YbiS/YcfS/YnhG family protein [Sphingobium chlorophenolicum]
MARQVSTGVKLAIGGGVAAVALLLGLSMGRGSDLPPIQAKVVKVVQAKPEAKPAKPVERTRAQPVAVDPHALMVKRVLPIDGPFRHGDYVWDEGGAPAKGPLIVTVDLKAQTLSVFRAGYEIGSAVILYGADDKPSPLGAFPIIQKDADHYSSTYNNAPMPYTLRLTSDGVAIHGSDVQWGSATHGCIGVPKAFAKKLFGVAKLGDLVVITNGRMLDTSQAS